MKIESKQCENKQNEHNYVLAEEQLLTPKEAANKLKVTPEQIRSLIRKRQLSAINLTSGKKRPLYRITNKALNDFLVDRWQPSLEMRKRKFTKLSQVPDFFPKLK